MNTPRRSISVEWRLRNAAGDDLPFQIHPGESISIGRDLSADLPVLHAGVSRHHALLELEADGLWLEDLHGPGGTLVNGEPVRRTRIESGDILSFGGVSFTLTSRVPADEETDPCRRLPRERLLSLLRLSRDIRAGGERGLLCQTIVQAAVEELRAERGIIFLRDPERPAFLPAATHPAGFLSSLPPGAEERLSLGPGARAIAPAGLGAPFGRPGKPEGILYLERGADRTFDPEDEAVLSAIAWVASPAVEAAGRLEAMRAWNSRLEGALASSRAKADRRGAETIEPGEPGASLFRLAEARLSREVARLRHVDDGAASAALEDAAVLLAAARRLHERRSARAEEIQIAQALAEAFGGEPGVHAGESALSVVHGGDLPILCAPDEMADALRLARSLLVPPSIRKNAKYNAKATTTPDGQWIDLELSAVHDGAGDERTAGPEGLEVLRRLVAERLGGGVAWSPGGEALRIRLSNLVPEIRETRLLGELARRGIASVQSPR